MSLPLGSKSDCFSYWSGEQKRELYELSFLLLRLTLLLRYCETKELEADSVVVDVEVRVALAAS